MRIEDGWMLDTTLLHASRFTPRFVLQKIFAYLRLQLAMQQRTVTTTLSTEMFCLGRSLDLYLSDPHLSTDCISGHQQCENHRECSR